MILVMRQNKIKIKLMTGVVADGMVARSCDSSGEKESDLGTVVQKEASLKTQMMLQAEILPELFEGLGERIYSLRDTNGFF